MAAGVRVAEEQVTWPVEDWLQQTRQWLNDPIESILQQGLALDAIDPSAPAANLINLGRELFKALFQGAIRDSWMAAQSIAQNRREGLRLRLGLQDARLHQLPWEALHDGDRPLATGTDVVFSRYAVDRNSRLFGTYPWTVKPDQPFRILMAIAAPDDQKRLELKQEFQQLQQELSSAAAESNAETPQIEVELLEQPGRAQLTQALEQGNYQIFHYAGHSDPSPLGGSLYLVNPRTGLTETLSGQDLAGLLANNGIRMAVLNSCRGAYDASPDLANPSGATNLAQALLRRGIPGVLAMAERIPDEVAIILSRLFYRNLKYGYPADLCLSRARQGLISAYGSQQFYWALPILYLHPEFNGHVAAGIAPVPAQLVTPAAVDYVEPIDEAILQDWVSEDAANLLDDELQSPEFDTDFAADELDPPASYTSKAADTPAALGGFKSSGAFDNMSLSEMDNFEDDYSESAPWPHQDSSWIPDPDEVELDDEDAEFDDLMNDLDQDTSASYEDDAATVASLIQQLSHPDPSASPESSAPTGSNPALPAQSLPSESESLPAAGTVPRDRTFLPHSQTPHSQTPASSPAYRADSKNAQSDRPASRYSNLEKIQTKLQRLISWQQRDRTSVGIGLGAGIISILTLTLLIAEVLPKHASSPRSEFEQVQDQIDSLPTDPFDPSSVDAQLTQQATPDLAAIALTRLQQQDIEAMAAAVEVLLERGALSEARAVLGEVPASLQANPAVNFLKGRLAWQAYEVSDPDFSVSDARRFWQSAVEQADDPTYAIALGFALYEEGRFREASQAWLQALERIEIQQAATLKAQEPNFDPNSDEYVLIMPTLTDDPQALTAYAGLALASVKLAQDQPDSIQATMLSKARKLYGTAINNGLDQFQATELAKNWLWTESTINDWQSLPNVFD
jgi:tetratricopeptide (TPR) repeat protein